jgi:hypothetical protein
MKIELQNVNTNKLHDELIKARIVPSLVESLDTTTWITVEDSEESAVMEVVSKHNPSPLPQEPSELDRLSAIEDAITMLMGV